MKSPMMPLATERPLRSFSALAAERARRAGERGVAVPEAAYSTYERVLAAESDGHRGNAPLPLAVPVLRAAEKASILIVGEGPGERAHVSRLPWDDRSGQRLRAWMGVDKAFFYDQSQVAIVPTDYFYIGRGVDDEFPERRAGAVLRLDQLFDRLPRLELTLLVGEIAQRQFLGNRRQSSLAQTVRAWREYAPHFIALPHPTPRNQSWFKAHPWFDRLLVPMLRDRIAALSTPASGRATAVSPGNARLFRPDAPSGPPHATSADGR